MTIGFYSIVVGIVTMNYRSYAFQEINHFSISFAESTCDFRVLLTATATQLHLLKQRLCRNLMHWRFYTYKGSIGS